MNVQLSRISSNVYVMSRNGYPDIQQKKVSCPLNFGGPPTQRSSASLVQTRNGHTPTPDNEVIQQKSYMWFWYPRLRHRLSFIHVAQVLTFSHACDWSHHIIHNAQQVTLLVIKECFLGLSQYSDTGTEWLFNPLLNGENLVQLSQRVVSKPRCLQWDNVDFYKIRNPRNPFNLI